jgi:hypothetical protein
LTAAGLACLASAAQAAVVTYSDGDLFLGFRATANSPGLTQTYLVDIGQASIYRDANGTIALSNIGSIAADLAALYGANWYTRDDLFWGIVGGVFATGNGDVENTLYATRVEPALNTFATPWKQRSDSQQGVTESKIQGLKNFYVGQTSTANSNFGIIQNTSDVNNWASFEPGGANSNATTSFGTWNPTIEGKVSEGLDLFRMAPSTTANTDGSLEGTFKLGSNGAVTFTSAVPEPSALALVALGGGALGFSRRRRPVTNN